MTDYKLNNLIDAIGSVNDYLVLESTEKSPQMKEQNFMKWTNVAAAFVLVTVLGLFAVLMRGPISGLFNPGGQITDNGDTSDENEAPDSTEAETITAVEFNSDMIIAGFSYYDSAYEKAMNKDVCDDFYHDPVFAIRSAGELSELLAYEKSHNADGLQSSELISGLDDEFFAENTLYLVYIVSGSISSEYNVVSVGKSSDSLYIRITYKEVYDCDEQHWFAAVTVSNSIADNVTYADATRTDVSFTDTDVPVINNDDIIPGGFAIRFVSWIMPGQENIYDTYTGTIQKDLVTAGAAATRFTPDKETLEDIYEKVKEYDICSIYREMTSSVLATDGNGVMSQPLTIYEITITANGHTFVIRGDRTADYYKDTDSDADNFMKFVNYMREVMNSTPEYQSLPDAVGGYQ